MKILVTGGAGFIGQHLSARLARDGHEVDVLDNFSTGRMAYLASGIGGVWRKDLRFPILAAGPPYEGYARIYHLACPASPVKYQRDPLATLETAILGTRNVLDFAASQGARVLLASTSEVYGDPKEYPQAESYNGNVNTYGPRGCYDEGKRAAETLCWIYQERGVETRIARIFNTYGPGMDPFDGRAVPTFIRQALTAPRMTIHGDGRQTRSLCYVDDLVEGLVRLMEADYRRPINLGNPEEVTVLDLARRVWEIVRSTAITLGDLEFLARPQDDPNGRCPDIQAAQTFLDWRPTTPLNEGLRRTVDWCRGPTRVTEAA